jgi:hypothetical protein
MGNQTLVFMAIQPFFWGIFWLKILRPGFLPPDSAKVLENR